MSEEAFHKASELIKVLNQNPKFNSLDNDVKLSIYANFKQGTVGDVNTNRPGMFDLKGKAKWDAWNSLKGTSKQTAWGKYVEITNSICGQLGVPKP